MWLIAQIKGFDALIKDLWSILIRPQIFSFYSAKEFLRTRAREDTQSQFFWKFSTVFNKQGPQMKAYLFAFSDWRKKKYMEITIFFLRQFFFPANSLFYFNKWCPKSKSMIPSIHFIEKKSQKKISLTMK